MKKQEHIHTHALLNEIARHLHDTEDFPSELLTEYKRADISPTSIHQGK